MAVTLHTTKGDVKIELHCDFVPRSTANFLALCAKGSYENTRFHRVIPSFIVQGGDPTGTGKTSRAATARRLPYEVDERLKFGQSGVVAFANGGRASKTGVGSQFFITLAPAPHLDGTCTIVGRVIHGMDAVEAIAAVPLKEGAPVDDVRIDKVKVHANPFADGLLELTGADVGAA